MSKTQLSRYVHMLDARFKTKYSRAKARRLQQELSNARGIEDVDDEWIEKMDEFANRWRQTPAIN